MATGVITNTLLDPNGTPVSGVTVLATLTRLPCYKIVGGTEVVPPEATTSDGSGAWSLTLEQTANLDNGAQWVIEERIPGAQGGTARSVVNVTSGSQTLDAARITTVTPSPTQTYYTVAQVDALLDAIGAGISGYRDVTQTPYNAIGNGIADDTAAIQSAIDDGGTIYFPPAKTFMVSTLTLIESVILQGSGSGNFEPPPTALTGGLKQIANTATAMIVVPDDCGAIRIRDLKLDGNLDAHAAGQGNPSVDLVGLDRHGIHFETGTDSEAHAIVENCYVHGFTGRGIEIGLTRRSVRVSNTTFHRNRRPSRVLASDCVFDRCDFAVTGAWRNSVDGSTISGRVAQNGLVIGDDVTRLTDCNLWYNANGIVILTGIKACNIKGCGIDRNLNHGIALEANVRGITLVGNNFHNNSQGANNVSSNISVAASATTEIVLQGNTHTGDGSSLNPKYGVEIGAGATVHGVWDENFVSGLFPLSGGNPAFVTGEYGGTPAQIDPAFDAGGGGGLGDVVGPASSTNNSLARFDGTTGKLLKDGAVIGTDVLAPAGSGAALTGIYLPGGTDVVVADGGTGSSTAAGARTNLGVGIGTDVQAFDTDLSTFAGLTPTNDDFIQRKAGAWGNRTPTQVALDLWVPRPTYKTTDEIVNNSTTLQDDNELIFPLLANEVWWVHGKMFVSGNISGDFKFAVTGPAGATCEMIATGPPVGGAAPPVTRQQLLGFQALGTSVTAGAIGAAERALIEFEGAVFVSATAGNLTVQWAQNAVNANDTTVRKGSVILARRLA